jgi:hypothetical protein
MKASLTKRIEILENKSGIKSTVWVTFLKFDMRTLRTPPNIQKYFPNHDFSKPDRETCRKYGRQNIKAAKAMKEAKIAGKDIMKLVDTSGEFLGDDSYYWEDDSGMTHDDWVKYFSSQGEVSSNSGSIRR